MHLIRNEFLTGRIRPVYNLDYQMYIPTRNYIQSKIKTQPKEQGFLPEL